METLEELKNKYKKLQEENNNLCNKIKASEKENVISKFTIGNCYINKTWKHLIKIISIKNDWVYYMRLKDASINRYNTSNTFDVKNWEKITSEQFKNAYLAVIKDIQDPDLEDREKSNWNIVYNSIISSINKEK